MGGGGGDSESTGSRCSGAQKKVSCDQEKESNITDESVLTTHSFLQEGYFTVAVHHTSNVQMCPPLRLNKLLQMSQ